MDTLKQIDKIEKLLTEEENEICKNAGNLYHLAYVVTGKIPHNIATKNAIQHAYAYADKIISNLSSDVYIFPTFESNETRKIFEILVAKCHKNRQYLGLAKTYELEEHKSDTKKLHPNMKKIRCKYGKECKWNAINKCIFGH